MSKRQFNPLDPVVIEYAYRQGFFPMPHPTTQEVLWFDPNPRTIIPLDGLHVSRSLEKSMRKRGYQTTWDQAFDAVVRGCASRKETWINQEFMNMYHEMFVRGVAHSVEVWKSGELVGGVFGLHFNGVFNGESMFSTATDASKVALVELVRILNVARVQLFEVQFMTSHLASLGAIEVPALDYHKTLDEALKVVVSWPDFNARSPQT